jgi:hypothetical protein
MDVVLSLRCMDRSKSGWGLRLVVAFLEALPILMLEIVCTFFNLVDILLCCKTKNACLKNKNFREHIIVRIVLFT